MLIHLVAEHSELTGELIGARPLLTNALQADVAALERSLFEEQEAERAADRAYWEPLRKELETLRHERK